jgi:hypothetical protein
MTTECNDSDGIEAGYNYLDTSFTGTKSGALSGIPGVFDMALEDDGTAATLADLESNTQPDPNDDL